MFKMIIKNFTINTYQFPDDSLKYNQTWRISSIILDNNLTMRKHPGHFALIVVLNMMLLASGCVMPNRGRADRSSLSSRYVEWQQKLTPSMATQELPSEEVTSLPIVSDTNTPESSAPGDVNRIFLHPGLSEKIIASLNLPPSILASNPQEAEIKIMLGNISSEHSALPSSTWIYALVAPFYTVADQITLDALSALWRGQTDEEPDFTQVRVTADTYAVLSALFGPANDDFVIVMTGDALEELALSEGTFISVLPLEDLNPRWKILRIDGQSPINADFSAENYPLTMQIWIEGGSTDGVFALPSTNYNPDLRTVLIMTGVTAMTRATAHRMAVHGNQYPGIDVEPWLTAADLVHISNEVAFAQNCHPPDPFQIGLDFCSSPDRIELLEFISADIIELSGNHMLDYGVAAMTLTLEMYAERGWTTFAGGWDLLDARSPAKITHNGNRMAFIGCNPVGPPNTWATSVQPGAAPCGDFGWMVEEIQTLRAQGYLPIVTLQYQEDYTAYPSPQMEADFQRLADAGALIVNGSQAHTPKSMVFYNSSFLHYGLGNLFFDQMEVYYSGYLMSGTREGFIDRLVFYDGELISIELLTTMLEDYARPRPMTSIERETLLTRIFEIALESYE